MVPGYIYVIYGNGICYNTLTKSVIIQRPSILTRKKKQLNYLTVKRFCLNTVGARVFAYRNWPDGYYYRGFVVKATDSKVNVYYDDKDDSWFDKNDPRIFVVLDEIPKKRYLLAEFVLAATSDKEKYAYGRIIEVAEHAYYVDIEGIHAYWAQFYQIRQLP